MTNHWQDAYDVALKDVDVLVMPTLVHPPPKLPTPGTNDNDVKAIIQRGNMITNVCPFNSRFHLGFVRLLPLVSFSLLTLYPAHE